MGITALGRERDSSDPGDVTRVLRAWQAGEERALDRLVSFVYPELKRLARRQLGRGDRGMSLDTTSLVHEVYLKLVDQSRVRLVDRRHFYAVASRAMRQIVIEHARIRATLKRGGDRRPLPLDARNLSLEREAEALLAVDEALGELEALDPRLARVVEHRFFAGFTIDETAEILGVSAATVERDWRRARAWLRDALDPPNVAT